MISVIVPTYNCAEYIRYALESVLRQTYKDFELIVINDGSTDNTEDILRPFSKDIKYIKKENSSLSETRNLGIKNSRGEFIAFLDSDDMWAQEKLQLQMECFNAHPEAGLVYSSAYLINESGAMIGEAEKLKCGMPRGNVFRRLLLGNFIPTSSVIIRRSCLEKAGMFNPDFKASQDYDLWLRVAKFYRVGFVNKNLIYYRMQRAGNLTNTDPDLMYAEHIEILRRVTDLGLFGNISLRSGISYHYLSWGKDCFNQERFGISRKCFGASLFYQPFNIRALPFFLFNLLPGCLILLIKRLGKRLLMAKKPGKTL